MDADLVGVDVVVGLAEEGSSRKGKIVKFDDSKIYIKFGEGKAKGFPYNPQDIVICKYQFDTGDCFLSDAEFKSKEDDSLATEALNRRLEKKLESLDKKKEKPKKRSKRTVTKTPTTKPKNFIEW